MATSCASQNIFKPPRDDAPDLWREYCFNQLFACQNALFEKRRKLTSRPESGFTPDKLTPVKESEWSPETKARVVKIDGRLGKIRRQFSRLRQVSPQGQIVLCLPFEKGIPGSPTFRFLKPQKSKH